MRIALVAGATGSTGREVVRELVGQGVRTVAHVRPDSPRVEEWRERFDAAGAAGGTTPWGGAEVVHTLSPLQPTPVFSLLGTTRARRRASATRGAAESYESIDYGLTALLIRAAVLSGSRPRFVYLSAFGVPHHTTHPDLAPRGRPE